MVSRETVEQVRPCLVHRKSGTARLGAPVRKDRRVDRFAIATTRSKSHTFSVDEKDVGTWSQLTMIGMPLLALRRDNGRERLRVILPRICRLPRPADNCHSNKYPLWVSAI